MLKVYVSAHDKYAAEHIGSYLDRKGYDVVSLWHQEGMHEPPNEAAWTNILSCRNLPEIKACDVLILVSCDHLVPGGKHVEAGIALGMGKPVIVLGKRENKLYWHPNVKAAADIGELNALLVQLKTKE